MMNKNELEMIAYRHIQVGHYYLAKRTERIQQQIDALKKSLAFAKTHGLPFTCLETEIHILELSLEKTVRGNEQAFIEHFIKGNLS